MKTRSLKRPALLFGLLLCLWLPSATGQEETKEWTLLSYRTLLPQEIAPEQIWSEIYLRGKKIGYSQLTYEVENPAEPEEETRYRVLLRAVFRTGASRIESSLNLILTARFQPVVFQEERVETVKKKKEEKKRLVVLGRILPDAGHLDLAIERGETESQHRVDLPDDFLARYTSNLLILDTERLAVGARYRYTTYEPQGRRFVEVRTRVAEKVKEGTHTDDDIYRLVTTTEASPNARTTVLVKPRSKKNPNGRVLKETVTWTDPKGVSHVYETVPTTREKAVRGFE